MDKVNDWNTWREYQKNGCQVMRPSGKSKCGRMPDAQLCMVCHKMACLEHAMYLQARALSGSPIRVQVCTDCIGDCNPLEVLSQVLPSLAEKLVSDIKRMKKHYARLRAMEAENR